MQIWKFRKKSFTESHILYDSSSIDIVRQREGAIVGVEGHFGNWELGIPFYVHHGMYPYFVAKRLANPYVDWLLHRLRTGYGGQIIYLEESEELVRQVKKGSFIGLVADQDARREGVFVDFFGRKASTFKGAALLSLIGGAKFFLATITFEGKGKYRLETKVLVEKVNRRNYKSLEEGIQKLTEQWVAALEQEVRKKPEQYFWVHRRWKTRPLEEQKANGG